MENKLHLVIYTPAGKYLEQDIDFLNVQSSDYNLGILPHHSPLVTTVKVSAMKIKDEEGYHMYAIGEGILKVEKDKTVLLLDSIESKDEIDIERALAAKSRAEERLANKKDLQGLDVKRAERALSRALARIKVGQSN